MENNHRWSPTTKLLVGGIILAFLLYLISQFAEVIPPFILASILAFILTPFVNRIERRFGIHHALATLLTYALLIGLAILLPVLIIPTLVDQIENLNVDIQEIFESIEPLLASRIIIGDFSFDLSLLSDQIIGLLQGLLEPLFGQTLGIAFNVISSAVWGIFILIVSFYLVKDGAKLWSWIANLVQPSYREDYEIIKDAINDIWNAFFRGQLTLALVVTVIFSVLGVIIGIPFTFAMAVFAGIMEFIPSIGHAIWLFIASLLLFFEGSTWLPFPNWVVMVIVIGLHLIFGQIDLNILIPRIIGRSVRLHPLVVILGIVVGAVLAGVLGVVLAAPTIATARVLGRYAYARLFDLNPFEDFEMQRSEVIVD